MAELFGPCLQHNTRAVDHALTVVGDGLVENDHRLPGYFQITHDQFVVQVVRLALAKDPDVFDQKIRCAFTHDGVLAAALAGCFFIE
ncbi:hypothetical protein D3C80_963670 [compost metagenome]